MLRLMIVDDQKLMSDGLKTILESQGTLSVQAVAASGESALYKLETCAVDLVLLDIRMPGMGGVQAVRSIKRLYPGIKVIMLTTFNEQEYIIDAIAGGADGYLLKDMDSEELFRAIESVQQGGLVMPAEVAGTLRQGLAEIRTQRSHEKRLQALGFTQREVEITRLLLEGFNNSQIAKALYLSAGTARNYVSSIYEKLGVSDRANAVIALGKLE